MTSDGDLPSAAKQIAERYPELWQAFTALGKASAEAGPLDGKTLRLIKIAMAVGAGLEGAVHSHVRRALDDGISKDEIRHVALAAMPTLGFATSLKALSWVEDLTGTGA